MKLLNLISLLALSLASVSLSAQDDAASRKGKIAVLPWNYITNDQSLPVDQYRKEIQSATANVLRSETGKLEVQDPMMTNTLLVRNEITDETIEGFLPGEIAAKLGVQYVVFGTYSLTNKGTTSSGSSVTTYKEEDKKKADESSRKNTTKGSAVTTTSSTTWTNYDARMEINIYDDNNQNVYSKTHNPFSADPEEVDPTLKWILRRSPWGAKAGK